MASVAKSVTLSFGLMSTDVSVHSALDKEKSGNKLVCVGGFTGVDPKTSKPVEHQAHDPRPIGQVNVCTSCDDIVPYTSLQKARPVGDGFVLLTEDEVTEAKVDVLKLKKATSVTPHPTEQVDMSTAPGEKLYYLLPNPGAQQTYAAFVYLVENHPEYTFMQLWTPRSRAGQFALKVKDGCLVWQERERAENIRPVPEVEAEAPAPMLKMADQVLELEGVVTDYDPATYEDTYERKIADIIATKEVISGESVITTPGVSVPTSAVAGMDALAKMLADAKAAKRPARKPAARKRPTKKAS